MKILSWNVNGLRAIYRKGFLDWLKNCYADIICLQETKIQIFQIPKELTKPKGYFFCGHSAVKLGYSGVAVYMKKQPLKIEHKIGHKKFDSEGRLIKLDYADFSLFNFYLPQGSRDKKNLPYKLEVYDYFIKYLEKIKNQKTILIGDFNIAHDERDLARPKQNQNNIMFTLQERRKLDQLEKLGFIDTFRQFHTEGGHYTWWPYFAPGARARNVGWRLDYAFVSKVLLSKLKDAFILNKVQGSDHCPIGIEIG